MKVLITAGTLLAAAWLPMLGGCAPEPARIAEAPRPVDEPEIDHLVAFARLYGYVRYFYPGDAAAAADWERFAIEGAGRVRQAGDDAQLKATLEALFEPIAPGLVLYAGAAPAPPPSTPPHAIEAGRTVSWQHFGPGLGEIDRLYKSLRLNRPPGKSSGGDAGSFSQSIDAKACRGMQLRLKAAVRAQVAGEGNRAQMMLQVVRPAGQPPGFFDNMSDRPITSGEWTHYEIQGSVADDARSITVGGYLRGEGSAWFDSIEVDVAPAPGGPWHRLPLVNGDFEKDRVSEGWIAAARHYRYAADSSQPFAGARSLRITAVAPPAGPLFEARTWPGELMSKTLGSGLTMQMPLALYADEQGTLPPAPRSAQPGDAPAAIDPDPLDATDARLRIADVVIAWNAFQHFYPYFDVVQVDWPQQLRVALRASLSDAGAADHLKTLQLLVAAARDGHGSVNGPGMLPRWWPPFRAQWIEGRAVIVRSLDEAQFRAGDIVLSLDGVPAGDRIGEAERTLSGSPQWRRTMAMNGFVMGDQDSRLTVGLLRDGLALEVVTQRNQRGPVGNLPPGAAIQEMRPGIWYVDLRSASIEAIRERLETLSEAKGIVFDLRGYPKDAGASKILEHLIPHAEDGRWMWVPQIIRPDHDGPLAFDGSGWNLQPVSRHHFDGKIAFLTDASAISYAESVMGYVEAFQLGAIVGSATAGTNGDVRRFRLPGGYGVGFTGMRVTRHDGSRQHLIGVLPTVPLEPTIAGIRQGRDEILERGLEIVDG